MRLLRYLLVNGLILAGAITTIVAPQHQGIANVFLATLWCLSLLASACGALLIGIIFLGLIADDGFETTKGHLLKANLPIVPLWADLIYDLTVFGLLAYNGWTWTASVWFAHTVVAQAAFRLLRDCQQKVRGLTP
jgi:hypothetical protein